MYIVIADNSYLFKIVPITYVRAFKLSSTVLFFRCLFIFMYSAVFMYSAAAWLVTRKGFSSAKIPLWTVISKVTFFTLETWAPIFKASYENLSKQTSKEKLEINLKKVLILKNLKKNLGKVMKNLGNICDRLRKILGCFKIVPRGPLAGSCTHIRWPCAL